MRTSHDEKSASTRNDARHTVLLLGSTGNLGSYILDILLRTPLVSRIVCLNRSTDALEKQKTQFKERGLDVAMLENDSRGLHFARAELHEDRFGLDPTTYEALTETVDLVLHNAWPVDFNRHIKSFQPCIRGVENLVLFGRCAAARKPAVQLVFVSSVAVASNFASAAPASRSSIPEVELTDWKLARTGYGQSKLLAERLLAQGASGEFGDRVRVAIARVGQLCGPVFHGTQGKWPPQEWVPSLIRSSIMLGRVPNSLGPASRLDWVPVDKAAQGLVDIATHFLYALPQRSMDTATPAEQSREYYPRHHPRQRLGHHRQRGSKALFFHIVNPLNTSWSALLPAILEHLPPSVQPCCFSSWVDKLHESIQTAKGFEGVDEGANPAAKLYDMFENLQDRAIRFPKALAPPFATDRMAEISPSIANLSAVSDEWMELFMRQWGWESFLK